MKTLLLLGINAMLSSLLCSCDSVQVPERDVLKIVNNTDKKLIVYVGLGGEEGTLYPDTSLPYKDTYLFDIPPKDYYYYYVSRTWQRIYLDLPENKFSVFLIDSDTVAKYGWNEVHSKNKIITRYDLTLQDLESKNRTISYP